MAEITTDALVEAMRAAMRENLDSETAMARAALAALVKAADIARSANVAAEGLEHAADNLGLMDAPALAAHHRRTAALLRALAGAADG